ncbi:MAG: efflux RND transporter permease subunit [Gammaproteobacteria bacterium]
MTLTALALRRPVTVCMFFACWVVVGLLASQRLPLERLPDIEFPGLFVELPYRNATPEDVERHITRPVEEALATLPGIQRMNSESRDTGAGVFVQFDWGDDLAARGVEARDRIDSIRQSLPADLERVRVRKFSAGDEPMMTYRLSSDARDLGASFDLLNRNLKRRLERLEGVSRVDLYGVEQKQVRIELNAERVAAHRVDLLGLAKTLGAANFALSAGDLTQDGTRYYVKPEGRLDSLEAIRAFVIGPGGLRLGDIAEVVFADPVLAYGRHLNRQYAVGVSIFKETGANLVDVAQRVEAEVSAIRELPEMSGVNLYLMDDQATDVKRSLEELIEAGLVGALLSILVLYLFLRDLKMTLIVTASVPLSLTITLAAMYFFGFSLNILTLMGLMLAVGMLVDNAVVVTESIFTERAHYPDDPAAATLAGVRGVGLAVTAGTLTTAIVFLPNIFGEQNNITVFLSHVALTICVSLLASLLVAVTLIPQLTTRMRVAAVTAGSDWVHALARAHGRLLRWTFGHRWLAALIVIAVLCSVVVPAGLVKADMFPQSEGNRLFLRYNINNVYAVAKVEEAVDTIENYLYDRLDEFEIESVYSYFDQGRAESSILLRPEAQRSKSTAEIRELIRKDLPRLAIGEPSFDANRSGAEGKLSVQIYGETSTRLRAVAQEALAILRQLPDLTDVRIVAEAEDWEVQVRVERERARQLGFSSQQVAEVVAGAMRGTELRPFRTATGEAPMLLQFRREDRANLDALSALPLLSPQGNTVSLGTVARLGIADVPGTIRREDRRTSLNIEFNTREGVTAEDAKKSLERVLGQMQFPAGYGWGYGRAFDNEQESMQVMVVNMLLALALIYLVMAALFESTLMPAAIVTGIGFSFIGVYWFFLLTGTSFSFMAMIGMLILMGIVVNNGIVLIDHVTHLRGQGLSREEALLQGSRDRLRPILMTAGTTVLGMVPLALSQTTIGGGGPPYYPMARAIIGGLTFSTVISLWLLPVIYVWLDDLHQWARRVLARARGLALPVRKISA